MKSFSLEEYLSRGVEQIGTNMLRASLSHPKASLFLVQHGMESKRAAMKRHKAEEQGIHIPPFLIASITNRCNLHCKGCYARAAQGCTSGCETEGVLTAQEWDSVFAQAEELGIEFILLAGGEPFVRRDVLETAGRHSAILFPVFTNGTMLDEQYLALFARRRNLLPVLSIEGSQATTDARRGEGVHAALCRSMEQLKQRDILFGASITVTKSNLDEVLSDQFVHDLSQSGVRAVVYVEYVPMDETSRLQAPEEEDRKRMEHRLQQLRQNEKDILFVSFPGDEKASGGCLAAGRGFFHINAFGGAEPCPFSPYSDTNIREVSLRDALESPLFRRLQENGSLMQEHIGGCTLFEQREEVEALLAERSK